MSKYVDLCLCIWFEKGVEALKQIRLQLEAETGTNARNQLLLQLIDISKIVGSIHINAPNEVQPLLLILRSLCVDRDQTIRSQTFRVLRYLATDAPTIRAMLSLNIDLLVSRSLERDSKYLWERMHALKFIRRMMAVDPSTISRSIVQSLVSIADFPKDDFRRVCLDAVRELVVVQPGLVASCSGLKTIVDSILSPTCQDIAGSLTLTLIFLLDQDRTRRYMRPSADILTLLSVFTDTSSPDGPEKEVSFFEKIL